jgi:O-antigen/teichoic acid export membrane protein
MTRVKRNIIANFAGQGWAALMSLAFVPLYIKYLGIEAYGLIGFFAMLQAAFQVLDLGLSQTMNREMARYSALPEQAGEARDFVRTLEFGYWAIGAVIGVAVVVAAPFIAEHWIKAGDIPVNTVQRAVMIMGIVSALQWPLSFYDGGLMGLHKQVLSNSIKIGMSTLSSCGSVFILWKVSPTITAFFSWQIIVSAFMVAFFTMSLWRNLPPADRPPVFNQNLLRSIWRFAAGMSGISISALILMQLDKLILSKLLNLEMFGYYTLAGVVSGVVPTLLVGPIFNALFPRFTSLVAVQDEPALKLLYHQGSQLMAVLVLPVAVVLAFFSFDLVLLWTGSAKMAGTVSPIVSVLVVGMAINALMTLPYALQLSHGWTSIGLRINALLIITLVPMIYYMTLHYGALGAAEVWIVLNIIYMIIGVPSTHRRFLKGEMNRWFSVDILPPLSAALLIGGIGRWLIYSPMPPSTTIISLVVLLLGSLLSAALVASEVRNWLFLQLTRLRSTRI